MNDTVTAVAREAAEREAAGGAAAASSPAADVPPAALSIEQMLATEGVMVSTTSGWSMWPLLRNRRDTIIVRRPADAHADGLPHRHDVVLYHRPADPATGVREAYVLHRIVDVERDAAVGTDGHSGGVAAGDAGSGDGVGFGSGVAGCADDRDSGAAMGDTDAGGRVGFGGGVAGGAAGDARAEQAAATPGCAVLETVYIIRGDNTFVDEHVPAHQIIGILDGCYRANRAVDLHGRRYRAYVRVWLAIYPLRRLWHAMWNVRLRPARARTPLRALWKALRGRR